MLEQHVAGVVDQDDGDGAMEEAVAIVALAAGSVADRRVVGVDENQGFIETRSSGNRVIHGR